MRLKLIPATTLVVTAAGLVGAVAPAAAQSVQLVPFGGQTFSLPKYVTGAPGDPSRVFVVERDGTIRLVKDGVTQATPFLDISGDVCSYFDCGQESGLASMALAPDYAASGLFYVFYARDSAVSTEQHCLRIDEFRRSAANPDVADPASRRIVLEIPHLETVFHNGGQLQFGPDGLLYISVGDGGTGGGNGQSTGTLLGKLLRINPAGTLPGQYSIPVDNPFAGCDAGGGRDLLLRAAQPVSILLRSAHGRPDNRGRRSGEPGGNRLRGERRGERCQLRLELLRGQPALRRRLHTATGKPHTAGARVPAPRYGLGRGERRLRDPRRSAALVARSLHLRRHLRRLRQ